MASKQDIHFSFRLLKLNIFKKKKEYSIFMQHQLLLLENIQPNKLIRIVKIEHHLERSMIQEIRYEKNEVGGAHRIL